MPLNAIICDKYAAAVAYIDHFKKGQASSLLDKISGSPAKAAAVRCVYAITSVGGSVRKISLAKSNILDHRPKELRSVLSSSKGLIIYPSEEADHTLRDEAQKWLIELFSKQTEYRASEVYDLGEHDGFSVSTLKKAKVDLGIDSKRIEGTFGNPWIWSCDRFLK